MGSGFRLHQLAGDGDVDDAGRERASSPRLPDSGGEANPAIA